MKSVLKYQNQPSKYQNQPSNDSEKYLYDYCGHSLGSKDTFRKHLMTAHYSKPKNINALSVAIPLLDWT